MNETCHESGGLGLEGFSPLALTDKSIFAQFLGQDPPETSELNFTNLFMWRCHYRPYWREWEGCLLVVYDQPGKTPFGLPPFGPGDKRQALDHLAGLLRTLSPEARIERAGEAFVRTHVDTSRYEVIEDRDQSDYVYRTRDLIDLSGRKLHQKKNHLNYFLKNTEFSSRVLDLDLVECALDMQEAWCQLRNCDQDPGLLSEDRAIYEALKNFEDLDYQGLALVIEDKVEAFALGEPLNADTVLVHIEKANPEIRGLYAAVNQLFCQELWSDYPWINREQDLGIPGLRQAKKSYQPEFLARKYQVVLK